MTENIQCRDFYESFLPTCDEVDSSYYQSPFPLPVKSDLLDIPEELKKMLSEDFSAENGYRVLDRIYNNDFWFGEYENTPFFRSTFIRLGEKWRPGSNIDYIEIAEYLTVKKDKLHEFLKLKYVEWGHMQTVLCVEGVKFYMKYKLREILED